MKGEETGKNNFENMQEGGAADMNGIKKFADTVERKILTSAGNAGEN